MALLLHPVLPFHMRVVLQQVRHVGIALMLRRPRRLPLLRGLRGGLAVVRRGLAGGLLAESQELAHHVVGRGQLDAVPHGQELGVDGVGQAGLVEPHELGVVVLPRADDEDLVLVLELRDGLVAVGPAVLQVLDAQRRGVGLLLQVGEQRDLVVDAGDLGLELVLPGAPGGLLLLLGGGGGLGGLGRGDVIDARVLVHEVHEQLLLLLGQVVQRQVVEHLLQGLGCALGLEKVDDIRQLRHHMGAEVGGLRSGGGGGGRGRGRRAVSDADIVALLAFRCRRGRAVRLGGRSVGAGGWRGWRQSLAVAVQLRWRERRHRGRSVVDGRMDVTMLVDRPRQRDG